MIKVRKSSWYKDPAFANPDDAPANCLPDLRIKENELSVWEIQDDDSNLQRVVTALAANGTTLSNIDYLLFDCNLTYSLGLKVKQSHGLTPDDHANREWHRDIAELSVRSTAALAVAIFHNSKIERTLEKVIFGRLKAAAANNEITISRLDKRLAAKLLESQSQQPGG